MTDIFDDPQVKAAMAAAGVVHKPGVADEVLRDLAPFLAEEGVDLNDLRDVDLERLNESLARATERYNQSLPREEVNHLKPLGGLGRGPSGQRHPKRGRHVSGHPGRRASEANDATLVRSFDRWLRRQAEIAAPSPGDESPVLGELLRVAHHEQLDLRRPAGVERLLAGFLNSEEPEPDEILAVVAGTLHDYVHFQLETSDHPGMWEGVHDVVEDVLDVLDGPASGTALLGEAIADTEQIPEDERRDALASTPLITAVTALLNWVGTGRKVSSSGGIRRADISYTADLLGIDAVGVAKLPPYSSDFPPSINLGTSGSPAAVIHARSMGDVPLLPSWWDAMVGTEMLVVNSYQAKPGPSATAWMVDPRPPLELAEQIVGFTVSGFVTENLRTGHAFFAEQEATLRIGHLLRALAPGELEPASFENDLEELLDQRVIHDLYLLQKVGVLDVDAAGLFVVPPALRGAVARGVFVALALLGSEEETD